MLHGPPFLTRDVSRYFFGRTRSSGRFEALANILKLNMMVSRRGFYASLALTSAILFGISTPISKLLLQNTNPFQLSGMMYLGAGLGLLPFAFSRGWGNLRVKPSGKDTQRILGMIVCGGLLGPVFLLFGLKFASASSVSLWLNFELFFTALSG